MHLSPGNVPTLAPTGLNKCQKISGKVARGTQTWGCFSPKYENCKSVLGLRRRVRIACPTIQKTTHFFNVAFHFLVFFPGDDLLDAFLGAAAPEKVRE